MCVSKYSEIMPVEICVIFSTSNLKYAFLFLTRTGVDMDRQAITVLSPQPRPLPNTLLMLSDLQFMDSHA